MALRRNKKNPDERGFSRNDQKKMLAADTPFVIKEAYNTIRTSLLFTQKLSGIRGHQSGRQQRQNHQHH